MRKLISCLLALTVVLSLLAVPAFASSATGSGKEVTVTLSGTAKPGENLCTVTVKVSGAPVAGIEFSIKEPSGWHYKEHSTADAEKLFDLVDFSTTDGMFRATGVKSGMEVEGEWTAMTITYQMDKKAVEGQDIQAAATVKVGDSGIYNAELQDHEVTFTDNGMFTVTIVTVKLGDVNDDGDVNTSDAALVAQHSVQSYTLTGDALDAGDVNHDGFVNTSDAALIAQSAVGLYEIK